jgi:HEAT repeat protein
MSFDLVIAGLIEDLDSDNWAIRENAKNLLLKFGTASVDRLMAAVRSQTGHRCWIAATILAEIEDPRCLECLKEALLSSHPVLGQVAAKSLEQYGELAVKALIEALPNGHKTVKPTIVVTLEKIGDPRAVGVLMDMLETTDWPSLRYSLIQALGVLGDMRAVELIRSFQHDENHHVRKCVQIALEHLSASTPRPAACSSSH